MDLCNTAISDFKLNMAKAKALSFRGCGLASILDALSSLLDKAADSLSSAYGGLFNKDGVLQGMVDSAKDNLSNMDDPVQAALDIIKVLFTVMWEYYIFFLIKQNKANVEKRKQVALKIKSSIVSLSALVSQELGKAVPELSLVPTQEINSILNELRNAQYELKKPPYDIKKVKVTDKATSANKGVSDDDRFAHNRYGFSRTTKPVIGKATNVMDRAQKATNHLHNAENIILDKEVNSIGAVKTAKTLASGGSSELINSKLRQLRDHISKSFNDRMTALNGIGELIPVAYAGLTVSSASALKDNFNKNKLASKLFTETLTSTSSKIIGPGALTSILPDLPIGLISQLNSYFDYLLNIEKGVKVLDSIDKAGSKYNFGQAAAIDRLSKLIHRIESTRISNFAQYITSRADWLIEINLIIAQCFMPTPGDLVNIQEYRKAQDLFKKKWFVNGSAPDWYKKDPYTTFIKDMQEILPYLYARIPLAYVTDNTKLRSMLTFLESRISACIRHDDRLINLITELPEPPGYPMFEAMLINAMEALAETGPLGALAAGAIDGGAATALADIENLGGNLNSLVNGISGVSNLLSACPSAKSSGLFSVPKTPKVQETQSRDYFKMQDQRVGVAGG